ncbi:MAG: c-type cytochrome [Nitrospiraceae bacterium]|nr:c-type cytochrome [Nitrospiraceae bacterium]
MRTKFHTALLVIAFLVSMFGIASHADAVDGAALYNTNCSGCHGPLASSSKLGRTAAQIQNAINSNMGGMGFLSSLTTADIQAIATALAPAPPPPTACTYTYSAWSACQSNNTQTRTVISSSPAGCTGVPVLSQTCTYVPPPATPPPATPPPATPPPATPPAGTVIPLPYGKHVYTYGPTADPVVSDDPAQARPIGIGSIATGGDTVTIKVKAGPFSGPVDVVLGIYDATFDAKDIYFMNITEKLVPLSVAVEQEKEKNGNVKPSKKFKGLVKWKTNVTSVDETVIGPMPVANLSPGLYVLHLGVSPTDVSDESDESHDNYYRWITYFIVQ